MGWLLFSSVARGVGGDDCVFRARQAMFAAVSESASVGIKFGAMGEAPTCACVKSKGGGGGNDVDWGRGGGSPDLPGICDHISDLWMWCDDRQDRDEDVVRLMHLCGLGGSFRVSSTSDSTLLWWHFLPALLVLAAFPVTWFLYKCG